MKKHDDLRDLPGYLDPEGFNPKDYEDDFRNAKNVGLTDRFIKFPALERVFNNSIKAATSRGSLINRLSAESKALFGGTLKDQIADALFQALNGVGPELTQDQYKVWHQSLCKRIIEICHDLKPAKADGCCWTYGNSQKVVNLVVKYLVIIASRAKEINVSNEVTKIGDVFLNIKPILDIPVDSYVLEASWNYNLCHKNDESRLVLPLKPNKEESGEFSSLKVVPWSKWNERQYRAYSESLHEVFERPFDWEGYVWVEVSKLRKEKKASRKQKKTL